MARRGTSLHNVLSRELLENKPKSFKHVFKMIRKNKWKCMEIERKVERAGIRGRVDAIFHNSLGHHVIVDWKFQKRYFPTNCIGNLVDSFRGDNSYILQLNLYRWLLNIDIDNVQLVVVQIYGKRVVQHECRKLTDAQILQLLRFRFGNRFSE